MHLRMANAHQLGSSVAFASAGGRLRICILGLCSQELLQVVQALKRSHRVRPNQDGNAL